MTCGNKSCQGMIICRDSHYMLWYIVVAHRQASEWRIYDPKRDDTKTLLQEASFLHFLFQRMRQLSVKIDLIKHQDGICLLRLQLLVNSRNSYDPFKIYTLLFVSFLRHRMIAKNITLEHQDIKWCSIITALVDISCNGQAMTEQF